MLTSKTAIVLLSEIYDMFSVDKPPNRDKSYYELMTRVMNKTPFIWIRFFSIAVIISLSASLPIQFGDARYKWTVTQNFVNDCDESNCANTGT
ncbi:MAG: hypothetical protein ACRD8W_16580, partial [Nitrososphaeraceae archaeon]